MQYSLFVGSLYMPSCGKYRNTAMGRIPFSGLLDIVKWKRHHLFKDDALLATTELAIRRKQMQVSTRAIKAIHILYVIDRHVTFDYMTAEQIHKQLDWYADKSTLASTRRVLDELVKHKLLTSNRGTEGGYSLNKPLSDISIYSVDKIWTKKHRNRYENAFAKVVNEQLKVVSVEKLLQSMNIVVGSFIKSKGDRYNEKSSSKNTTKNI